ncbi:MAG TPA: hypothetical protein VH701_28040 [Vicinamibacterales bacterium]
MLAQLSATRRIEAALADAVSGVISGTVFTGRTCSALTAGVVALGAVLGTLERSRLRVLRMIFQLAVSGDARTSTWLSCLLVGEAWRQRPARHQRQTRHV